MDPSPEPRVVLVVSAPATSGDPEDVARAITLAVKKIAPDADIYYNTAQEA